MGALIAAVDPASGTRSVATGSGYGTIGPCPTPDAPAPSQRPTKIC